MLHLVRGGLVFGLATPFHCHTVHVARLVCTARFHIAALRSRFAGMLFIRTQLLLCLGCTGVLVLRLNGEVGERRCRCKLQ